MAFPRFFTIPSGSVPQRLADNAPVLHAVDTFITSAPELGSREWVIATDPGGALHALAADGPRALPDPLPGELAYNEVVRVGRKPRQIAAKRFYLFSVRLLEQPSDAPGLNDPVYLQGTMTGPWPNEFPEVAEGQLTVTRGDAMQGIVGCAPDAFHYAGATGVGALASKCLHLLLPGGREEEIRAGEDIVVAYCMPPPDLALAGAGNDTVICDMLHELLVRFQEDLVRAGSLVPLAKATLPVPSRAWLEAQLSAQGYEIAGDVATRRIFGKGIGGTLASMFGAGRDRVELPPQGTLDEFLRIAGTALASLPGWPSPVSAALGERLVVVGSRVPPAARVAATPRPTVGAEPPSLPPRPPAKMTTSPADWMSDFEDGPAPRSASAKPPPRPSAPKPRKPLERRPSSASGEDPEWMKDFQ